MASLRFLIRGHCCHQHWLSWSNCWRTVDAVLSAWSPWSCGLHRTSEGTSRHLLTCVLSKDWTEGLLCARLCGRGWAQVDFGEQGSSGTTLYSYILCPPWPRAEAPGQLASGPELREPMHSWGSRLLPRGCRHFFRWSQLCSLGKDPSTRRVLQLLLPPDCTVQPDPGSRLLCTAVRIRRQPGRGS